MPRSKPWSQFPRDPNLGAASLQCLDYLLTQTNQLLGQGDVPPASGVPSFGTDIIDPRSAQIISAGGRPGSLITPITFNAAATAITFYWDGTNSSGQLTIYRDDGSIFGPTLVGSPYAVTGLAAATRYFFYPYWDDVNHVVRFATIPDVSVGTPPVAFPAYNIVAQHQQIMRGHITLASVAGSTGILTGSGSGSGGGGGGGGSGCPLAGAPVKLYGDPSWWSKTLHPQSELISITTETGRSGMFSPTHRMYQSLGLLPLKAWTVGDMAVTDDGEEKVVSIHAISRPGALVERYEATKGHLYSAWGFLSHNAKPI